MEETRIGLLLQSIREMVAKERDIAPIVAKCVDAMEEGINDVSPEGDTTLVAEKFKVNLLPCLCLFEVGPASVWLDYPWI